MLAAPFHLASTLHAPNRSLWLPLLALLCGLHIGHIGAAEGEPEAAATGTPAPAPAPAPANTATAAATTPPAPTAAAPLAAVPQPLPSATSDGHDRASIAATLDKTKAELKGLPSAEAADGAANKRRSILERRQDLLLDTLDAIDTGTTLEQQLTAVKKAEAAPAPAAPTTPPGEPAAPGQALTPEGLKALKSQVEQGHSQVAQVSEQLQKIRARADQLPDLIEQAQAAITEAADNAGKLAASSADGNADLLTLQQQNAGFASELAQLKHKNLDTERRVAQRQGPLLSTQLDLLKQQLTPLEKAFDDYRSTLHAQQQAQAQALEQEVQRKQQAADRASSAAGRFVARWETRVAQIEKEKADLAGFQTQLSNKVLVIENGLKKDQADLQELKGLIDMVGLTGPATRLLRSLYGDIEKRRRDFRELSSPATLSQLDTITTEAVTIAGEISQLRDDWQQQYDAVLAAGDVPPEFSGRAEPLLGQVRDALHSQGILLREVSRQGRKLHTLPAQRLEVLDQLEDYVLRNVLWMQDARPLDSEVLANAHAELFSQRRPDSLVNQWRRFDVRQLQARVGQTVGHAWSTTIALLLGVLLPGVIWWRLRGYARARSGLLLNLAGTAVFPLYLVALASLLEPARSEVYSVLWTNHLLLYVAAILQLWLLSRVFFRPAGIAVTRFKLPANVARSLSRVLNLWAAGALFLLIPEAILSNPPFEYTGVPRLLYTAMMVLVVITLIGLLRPKSALMSALLSAGAPATERSRRHQAQRFLARYWPAISGLISLFLVGIVVMDVLGFRYTALSLSQSVIATVFIVAVALATYWVLVSMLDKLMWTRLRASTASAPSETLHLDQQRLERQVRRGMRALLLLATAMLIALSWKVGDQRTLPLMDYDLYSVIASDGSRDYVTIGDLVNFALIMVFLGWLLKELKPLFELLVFPYLNFDRGKRYALVTIAGYVLFGIGLLVALSILKVDLTSLGWLVAAMGVGLGFGLQEIFANFISGLILLLERPIRVGDMVTIGNVMGNVSHISFRATTVIAFDNEEIIVPNKELITGQVTNWTLGSTVTRINIPIGVAYGTDCDRVSEILMAIATSDPEVLDDPPPVALFMNHGDSALEFELRVFLGTAGVRLSTRDRLNREINKAFKQHGIDIPFPQRDLHIRHVDWPGQVGDAAPETNA